jgi:O-succinylbenzoic acid--CoA ligase
MAILFRCWLAGATAVIADSAFSIAEALATHRITHVSMVATQLRRLVDGGGLQSARSALSAVLLGGGPTPETLLETAHAEGLPLHTTYGMTETSSQVTTTPPGASLDQLKTSGRRLPYREVRISDRQEILVRGRTLFQGYVTGSTVHDPTNEDGWLHTGDLGRLDDEGYLHVTGRKDNQFTSGGENIQPEVVERALVQLRGIRQAVVVPIPDAEFSQRPVAFVKHRGHDNDLPLTQWRQELEATLPRFMIPDRFYAWPQRAKRTGPMKVSRDWFREEAQRRQRPRP